MDADDGEALLADHSIPRCFERQARRYPQRIAVVGSRETMTYDALNRAANQWARALLASGHNALGLVAILLPKDSLLFTAILATAKAGRPYLILDPAHPAPRLARLVADAGAPLLITDAPHAPLAREIADTVTARLEVACLSGTPDGRYADTNLDLAPATDALLYLVYTSGSTGTPKGVMQTQRNVLHNIQRHVRGLRLTAEDRLTLIASCSTGQAVTDIYSALLCGASLYPIDVRECGFTRLAEWLRASEITIYHSSASIFRSLLDSLDDADRFPSVRVVKLGSEPVYRRDLERWRRHFSARCVFVNALSSSEAGLIRQNLITHDAAADPASVVPVGYPVDGVDVVLVDEMERQVPTGEAGEIVLRGDYLSPGYWNSPTLTATAFRRDADRRAARSFPTGDRGRLLPDGRLIYLGRGDEQVKIRGFRVERAEVEAAIVEEPGVRHAVVVIHREGDGPARLTAYVVAQDPMSLTPRELRARLRARLPDHMVPTVVVMMDSLPLTAGGKVDVQSLPPPAPAPAAGVTSPRTPLEWQLAAIWEELLDTRPVGVDADFFDLGGHSLLAIEMMDRVEKLCGVRLPLSMLLRSATVERVAAAILEADPHPPDAALLVVQEGHGLRPFIFLHGDFNGGGFYCRRLAARLGNDRPLAVMTPHGHDGHPIPPTIEAMAADRVRVLRAFQPRGPYLLGGYCNGGLVAYGMAHQLVAAGETVALLVLVDASALNVRFTWLRRLVAGLGALIGLDQTEQARWFGVTRSLAVELRKRPRAFAPTLRHLIQQRMPLRVGAAAVRAHDSRALERVYHEAGRVYRDIMDRYVPPRYDGRVVLLHTRTMEARAPHDPTAGWSQVASRAELQRIAGEHQTCVTEHLDDLAARLSGILDQIEPEELKEGTFIPNSAASGIRGGR